MSNQTTQPIHTTQTTEPPLNYDEVNLAVATKSLYIARVSLIVTVALGVIGVLIAWWYGRISANLAKSQLTLQQEQSHQALQIDRFNELLTSIGIVVSKDSELVVLSTNQLDSFVRLNEILTRQSHVMIDLYNINAEDANRKGIKFIRDQIEDINSLGQAMNEIEPSISVFREMRDRYAFIKMESVNSRLSIINTIYDRFEIFKKVGIIIPARKVEIVADSCLNEIGQYRWLCYYNIARGVPDIDTSYMGSKLFTDAIYHFMDFEDSIGKYIGESRIRSERNLRELERVIEINSKTRNQKEKRP